MIDMRFSQSDVKSVWDFEVESEGGTEKGAWNISFKNAVATFTDTHYMRGPLLVEAVVSDYIIKSTGDRYLAAHIDLETGVVEIKEGGTIREITDTALSQLDAKYRIPLYHIYRDPENPRSCQVKRRYVYGIPCVVAYV